MVIVGMILGTLIGNVLGTGIVYSWFGVRSGLGMTDGARGIARCESLSMDSTSLVVVSP